jgi:hypothetical protein
VVQVAAGALHTIFLSRCLSRDCAPTTGGTGSLHNLNVPALVPWDDPPFTTPGGLEVWASGSNMYGQLGVGSSYINSDYVKGTPGVCSTDNLGPVCLFALLKQLCGAARIAVQGGVLQVAAGTGSSTSAGTLLLMADGTVRGFGPQLSAISALGTSNCDTHLCMSFSLD